MKHRLFQWLILIAIFELWGCMSNPAVQKITQTDKEESLDVYNEPLEYSLKYYYFTESQLQSKKGNIDKAIVFIDKAIQIDPNSIFLQKEKAFLYLRQKKHEDALSLLEAIIQKDPKNIEAIEITANLKQVLKQDPIQIAALYEKVIQLDPQKENVYLLLGEIYIRADELDKAMVIYKKLVKYFPESYAGYYYLGKIYAQQNQFQEAEKAFLKTLELEENLEAPHFDLIEIYKAQNLTPKVIQEYQTIINLNSNNYVAKAELACWYSFLNETQKASEIFDKLGKEINENPSMINKMIQYYLSQKRFDEAMNVFENMLEVNPSNSEIHFAIALTFDGMDQKEKAIDHLSKVKSTSINYQRAVIHQALLYKEIGKNDKAIHLLEKIAQNYEADTDMIIFLSSLYEEENQYEKAETLLADMIEKDAENTKLHFRLGVLYDKWKKPDLFEKHMKLVIQLDPEDSNALNYLGYSYADAGVNLDEAQRLIEKALEHKPNDGYITDSLGWVFYKKGDYQKAVEQLKKAVQLIPDDPILLEHLGDAYLKMDQIEDARKCYQKAIEHKKEDVDQLHKKINQLTKIEQ
ncbi:MAG: tetratricopeptide repeat protein [Desulfobacterales bacterium]|nr:tetratricopeptide repeat protein [Desulfobacterales bacterium]